MGYNTLGFAIHNKCSAACDICCFSCNPSSNQQLDERRIIEYINEAQIINTIDSISITGGEPFLAFDELNRIIAYSSKKGFKTSTVTNGFWATTFELSMNKLSILKKSGLNYLSISHDFHHMKYVNTSCIVNILKAAMNLNIPVTLQVIRMKGEKIGEIIDSLGSVSYYPTIKIGPCIDVGSAKINYDSNSFDRTVPSNHIRCPYGGNVSVLFDGNIYPCCSQVITETFMSIGNFYELSLTQALNNLKNNALLYLLRNYYMDIFIDFAKKNFDITIPQKVINPCQICQLLFTKEHADAFSSFTKDVLLSNNDNNFSKYKIANT